MRIFVILIFAAMFLPACAVSHQGDADIDAVQFALSDAGHPAKHYKFDDEEYLRGMSNAE
jgi:hypothetical protein